MNAVIIVKHIKTDKIAQLFQVPSLDEGTVRSSVRKLCERYSADQYKIDLSQIVYAIEAHQAA